MSHSHNHHSHGKHSHHHGHNANRKALFISFGLIFAFMVIEFIGGMMTNSLALLSDAGHMLSDAAALGLSLAALAFGGTSVLRYWLLLSTASHCSRSRFIFFGKRIIAFSALLKLQAPACWESPLSDWPSILRLPGF